jgi:hypothetical protein
MTLSRRRRTRSTTFSTTRKADPPAGDCPPTSLTTGWVGNPRHLDDKEGTDPMDVMSLLAANNNGGLQTVLWIVAAVLVIADIVTLIRGAVLYGVILIVIGLLVGPGGVSIFT